MLDPEEEKLFNEFEDAFEHFLNHWEELKLPPRYLIHSLITKARIEACFACSDFYVMLGEMTHILTHELVEQYEDIQNNYVSKEDYPEPEEK